MTSKEVFRINFSCTKTFLSSFSFFHKSSVIVHFTFKMVKLNHKPGCPDSQHDHQFASSLPHCNCPECRAKPNKVRRTDEMREIILEPLETNVHAVIPLPRIIEVQEANKTTDLKRRMELRGNMNNNADAVISKYNDSGTISERNNQTTFSNSG